MKVIIAGSRNFNNYELLKNTLIPFIIENNIEEIVSGGAKGADKLGILFGNQMHIPVKIFYPDWEKYGKSAGIIRNHQMGDYADYLIAFWDGKSHGTKDMIEYMKKLNKHGKVVLF